MISLVFHVSVCPSVCGTSVSLYFCFPDDNLPECQWIFIKLGVCVDVVDIWFGIANGQISSIFDRVICLQLSVF